MHKYFKAAGFLDFITEKGLYEFLNAEVVKPENLYSELNIDTETTAREFRLMFNKNIGIAAVLLYIPGRPPVLSHYYPFYETYEESSGDTCTIERHCDKETFSGIIDNEESGITIIFWLINSMDYRGKLLMGADPEKPYRGTYFSAFAASGKVILPVIPQETEYEIFDEFENFNEFGEIVPTEDIYTIVEQTFIPWGVECDQYMIVGEITAVNEDVNSFTNEPLWLLKVSCNGIVFRLCMRKQDLLGEPAPGRRIKCGIWLQGHVNLET